MSLTEAPPLPSPGQHVTIGQGYGTISAVDTDRFGHTTLEVSIPHTEDEPGLYVVALEALD